MKPVSIVITVEDDAKKQAQLILNVVNQDVESDLSVFLEIARFIQMHIDSLSGGMVVGCGLIFDVPIEGLLKGLTVPNCDIHKGALFVLKTVDGWFSKTRIPAFDESKIVPGTAKVDVDNSDVALFISDLENGISVGGVLYDFVDTRNNQVIEVVKAYEQFNRSRSE